MRSLPDSGPLAVALAPPPSRLQTAMQGPWLHLIYLVFVFVPLLFMPSVSARALTLSLLAVALFLPIHFHAWRPGAHDRRPHIAAVALIGLALLPFNPGANTFIIYTMAMAGARLEPRPALLVASVAWLAMTLEFILLGYPPMATVAYCGMNLLIGGMVLGGTLVERLQQRQNAALRLSQDEVSRLAALAERERIGRDLHDLLGHTLSLVVLKSELAGKLLERDAALARRQISEVEIIARQALTEVREAVSGYRQNSLSAELANCRLALIDAGVTLHASLQPLALSPPVEAALALCVREAITNVIRHAGAQRVSVELRTKGEALQLVIADDGRGGIAADGIEHGGNGLAGMRERLAGIDASLSIESAASAGSRLTIRVAAPWQLPTAALASAS